MITTRYCPQCGAANEESSTLCFSCGHEIEKEPETEGRAGTLLHERYLLEAIVGTGGFSVVYRALDTQAEKRVVAVKQINLQNRSPEEVIEATDTFNREVVLLTELNHPQIPQLIDSFGDREHWYLVLEFLEGETLESRLEQYATQHKPIPLEETLFIGQQLCTVLNYLHTFRPPIIFRDLKPGNILRTPGGKLYLIDFGIARRYQPGKAQDTQRLGSPGYAAPEQYGRAQTTTRADIYSLGTILHQLLAGDDPSARPRGVAPQLPVHSLEGAELINLINAMLSSNPLERPPDVRNVSKVLENVQQKQQRIFQAGRIWQPPVPQPLPPNTSSASQIYLHALASAAQVGTGPRRRFSRRRVVAASVSAVGVAVTGFYFWNTRAANAPAPPVVGQLLYTYSGHTEAVNGVTWSPDSSLIASCARDNTVQIWPRPDKRQEDPGQALSVVYPRHTDIVNDVVWSPNGLRLASCSNDRTVQVYNTKQETIESDIVVYRNHIGRVNGLAWSPAGDQIASCSDDGTVHIWNARTAKTLLVYFEHQSQVLKVAWSPDNTLIASVDMEGYIHIWNPLTGQNRNYESEQKHRGPINDVAWSPGKDTLLATCGDDETVKIWDKDSNLRLTYEKQHGPIYSVAWSPSGKALASAGIYTPIHIWDLHLQTLKTCVDY
ncbi:MAG TPA: protein kinase, partial [Ktedonobacteraceae bacterium]|nr:protein kinase [Ktedonobacteraceae bacterium]